MPDDELLYLRGPSAIVVDLDGAWSKSNLIAGGCKHDVWEGESAKIESGLVVYCVKCGCAIVSRDTVARLVREIEEFDS